MRKGRFLVFLLIFSVLTMSVVNADELGFGSQGSSVVKVQQMLLDLGYFEGAATGIYGNMTVQAVKKFQVNNGFIATGSLDDKLQQRLTELYDKNKKINDETKNLTKDEMKYCQSVLKEMGYYEGKIDGIYGPMTASAIKKFQSKAQISVTGTVTVLTFNKIAEEGKTIFGTTGGNRGGSVDKTDSTNTNQAESAKVELLDWWTGAQNVFYIGAVARVTDVWTGASFVITRTYGTNHADCEAMTAEDSKIIKEVWGGDWSWNRRPVIIEIDGRRLAASMAAMPHAGLDSQPANAYVQSRSGGYGKGYNLDKVKDNGMDGHFDVHFLNSRTHGTNTVNKAHQNAVMEAAGAK